MQRFLGTGEREHFIPLLSLACIFSIIPSNLSLYTSRCDQKAASKRKLLRETNISSATSYPPWYIIQSSLVGHFWDHLLGYYFAIECCHFGIINIPALKPYHSNSKVGTERAFHFIFPSFKQFIVALLKKPSTEASRSHRLESNVIMCCFFYQYLPGSKWTEIHCSLQNF